MIDKKQLEDKQVAFRIAGTSRVNLGTVKLVEDDGFWIESLQLTSELQQDAAWAPAIKVIQNPVMFVPTSSLMFLIATKD
jgi:hypothetical protein